MNCYVVSQVALVDTINVRLTSCENYLSENELDGRFEDQRRWCAEKLAVLIACIEDERRSRSSDEAVISERIDMVEQRLDLPRQHDQASSICRNFERLRVSARVTVVMTV